MVIGVLGCCGRGVLEIVYKLGILKWDFDLILYYRILLISFK